MSERGELASGLCGCVVLIALMAFGVCVGVAKNLGGQEDVTGVCERAYVDAKLHYFVELRGPDGTVQVLTNRDAWLWGKWDSANFHAKFREGRKYRVHVTGYRVPFLSWFKNVVRVEELP